MTPRSAASSTASDDGAPTATRTGQPATAAFWTSSNESLSDLDRLFIAGEKMYPGRGGPEPTVQTLEVVRGVEQEIAEAGEEDVFTFTVGAPGRHVIETAGSTDMVMVLFGPDNRNLKIAEDDDGGEGRNARIAADLGPGEHFVAVRHYNPAARGAYRILVTAS